MNQSVTKPFDKALLSVIHSFDRLRTNGVEGIRANGEIIQCLPSAAQANFVML